MQLDTDGTLIPCCRSSGAKPLGSVRTQGIGEVWNGEEMRKRRLAFLKGEVPPGCDDCFRREEWGSSLRLEMNKKFHDYFIRVKQTEVDGSLSSSNPVTLGLRFSNLCNFKCRSCSTHFSSSIAAESSAVNGTGKVPVSRAFDSFQNIVPWFDSVIPSLIHVYFAGGEPLLDDHHYLFLEALLSAKQNDVELVYNTNFSTLTHRDWDVTSLWSHFKRVRLMASLDAVDEAAEIIRKGTRWAVTEKNFSRLRESVPHVKFAVYPTVSAMNAFHLPKAITRWIELGMIRSHGDLEVNVLTKPAYLHVRIFNDEERKLLIETYQSFSETLAPAFRRHVTKQLDKVLAAFADQQDLKERQLFRQAMFTFDSNRKEKFVSNFPELIHVLYGDTVGTR